MNAPFQLSRADHIAAAHQRHSDLKPTLKFYPNADKGKGQWRRYISPTQKNITLISEALYIENACTAQTPPIIIQAKENYKELMIINDCSKSELKKHPESYLKHLDRNELRQKRLINIQARRNMVNVMAYLFRKTDIITREIGHHSNDSFFCGVSYQNICDATKLSKEQVKNAIQTLIKQGSLHAVQRKVKFKTKRTIETSTGTETIEEWEYRSKSNMYQVTEAFLKEIGLLYRWREEAKTKKIARNKAIAERNKKAQEEAGERAAQARLGNATHDGKPVQFRRNVKQEIVNLETGEVTRFNSQDRRERLAEREGTGRADFEALLNEINSG